MSDLPDWLDNIDETIEDVKSAEDLNDISSGINDYYIWPLVVLGVPGNMLTIITLIAMGKMTPGAFFITMLAASDLAALITKCIQKQLIVNDVHWGDVGCKMRFLPIYFSTLANWTLVLIGLERFISVCYPLQKAYLFTKKRSYIAAAVLVITFLFIYVPLFAAVHIATFNGCGVDASNKYFWTVVWYWINASLVIFIPFILSMTLTVLIILGLRRSRIDRRSILRKDESEGSSKSCTNSNSKLLKETEKVERMLTIMLILAMTIFVIFSLPACIYFLANKNDYDDKEEEARWDLFNSIQYMLFDTTHAINFFIYFLSARRFRTHLISILTCKKARKQKHSEISNQTDSSVVSGSTTNRI